LAAVFAGSIIVALTLKKLTLAWDRGFELVFAVSPAVGIAAALKAYWKRRNVLAFAAGVASAAAAFYLISIIL